MVVFVDLDNSIQAFLECRAVGCKADNGEDDVSSFAGLVIAAYSVDFGGVAGVDAVAGGRTCIAGNDGEVRACDAKC